MAPLKAFISVALISPHWQPFKNARHAQEPGSKSWVAGLDRLPGILCLFLDPFPRTRLHPPSHIARSLLHFPPPRTRPSPPQLSAVVVLCSAALSYLSCASDLCSAAPCPRRAKARRLVQLHPGQRRYSFFQGCTRVASRMALSRKGGSVLLQERGEGASVPLSPGWGGRGQ